MTNLNIKPLVANILSVFPEHDDEEMSALKESIQRSGQLLPILVKGEKLVDGRARLKICEELGIQPLTLDIGEAANEDDYAKSVNMFRRHSSKAQLAFYGAMIATMEKGSNQHTAGAACSRKEAAKLVGVSEDSIDRAHNIMSKGCPKLIEMVEKGGVSLSVADKLVKNFPSKTEQEEIIEKGTMRIKKDKRKRDVLDLKRAQAQQLAKNNVAALETLKGVYSVIYADPPWNYGGNNEGSFCDPSVHYPLMSTEEIMKLPVKDCLAPDASIYLWVPSCLVKDGIAVLESWGVHFVNTMVWCKNKAVMSQGATKTAHELLLIGRKGTALHETSERLNSWVEAPVSEHSKKPEIFAQMLDDLYPGFPKLEMFARKPRSKDWTVFGNQVVEDGVEHTENKDVPVASSSQPTVMQQLFAANDPRSQMAA